MHLEWSEKAWGEYTDLQSTDKSKIKKINSLIKDIMRNGVLEGIGSPEALKDNLKGYYSRHINDKDRLRNKGDGDNYCNKSTGHLIWRGDSAPLFGGENNGDERIKGTEIMGTEIKKCKNRKKNKRLNVKPLILICLYCYI